MTSLLANEDGCRKDTCASSLLASVMRQGTGDVDSWVKRVQMRSDEVVRDAMRRASGARNYELLVEEESKESEQKGDVPESDSGRWGSSGMPLGRQLERQLEDFGYGDERCEDRAKELVHMWRDVTEEAVRIKVAAKRESRLERADALDKQDACKYSNGRVLRERTLYRHKANLKQPEKSFDPVKRMDSRHALVSKRRAQRKSAPKRDARTVDLLVTMAKEQYYCRQRMSSNAKVRPRNRQPKSKLFSWPDPSKARSSRPKGSFPSDDNNVPNFEERDDEHHGFGKTAMEEEGEWELRWVEKRISILTCKRERRVTQQHFSAWQRAAAIMRCQRIRAAKLSFTSSRIQGCARKCLRSWHRYACIELGYVPWARSKRTHTCLRDYYEYWRAFVSAMQKERDETRREMFEDTMRRKMSLAASHYQSSILCSVMRSWRVFVCTSKINADLYEEKDGHAESMSRFFKTMSRRKPKPFTKTTRRYRNASKGKVDANKSNTRALAKENAASSECRARSSCSAVRLASESAPEKKRPTKPPKLFSKQMEQRAYERAKKRRMLRERYEEQEQEKLERQRKARQKQDEDDARKRRQEKKRKHQLLKQKKEREEAKVREARLQREQIKLARFHQSRSLLFYYGFGPWRKLVRIRKLHSVKAERHNALSKMSRMFTLWKENARNARRQRFLDLMRLNRRADQFYRGYLKNVIFGAWARHREMLARRVKMGLIMVDFHASRRAFRAWASSTRSDAKQTQEMVRIASEQRDRKLRCRAFHAWVEATAISAAESEILRRKRDTLAKVKGWLDEF